MRTRLIYKIYSNKCQVVKFIHERNPGNLIETYMVT